MTPQELKNSILHLAIQGKLVEQRQEEGTGEELYQQIQAEKQKLIKAGTIKKEKPLPEITEDEKPFDIPESWKWVRWGNLSESIQYGYNAPAQESGRIKMVRISDIQDDKVLWDSVPFCDIKEDEISTYLLRKDDILFARTGGTVGKSYLVKEVLDESIYAGYLIRTRYSSLLCPEYMKHFMSSQLYWTQLRNGTIATAQPNCNGQTLSKMILPLPPLAEQMRIVAKIEELLPYIDRYEQAWSKLEEFNKRFPTDMQKSILHMAIQGKLVEQHPRDGTGDELYQEIQTEKQRLIKAGIIKKDKTLPGIIEDDKPFDIPESWKWVRFGSVINIVSARRVHQSDWKTYGMPFYRAREIAKLASKGFVDNELYISQELFEELSKSGVPHPGDLMVTAVGTLGKTYIVQESDKFYYKDTSVICLENYAHISPQYLKYIMQSEMLINQIKCNSSGTTVATLTMVRMVEYLLPLPPLAEQKRIVKKLEEILPLCEKLKR